jgi:hypothetical protein
MNQHQALGFLALDSGRSLGAGKESDNYYAEKPDFLTTPRIRIRWSG